MIVLDKKLEKWYALKRQKIIALEDEFENIGGINYESLSTYFFTVNQMGWINCDRFVNTPKEQLMAVSAQSKGDNTDTKVFAVFKRISTLLDLNKSGDIFSKTGFPSGEEISIIGIRVRNGFPEIARLDTTVGRNNLHSLNYTPTTLKNIRRILEELKSPLAVSG